jgi:hypothetical protein
MNIDEKIKRELEQENPDFDSILIDDEGLFERVSGSFQGGMKRWVIMIYLVAMVVGVLFLWAGYRFFIATELHDQIFWGICFIGAMNMQGFIKQWIFMETNRNSIMREIKRVEIAVARLTEIIRLN